MLSSNKEHGSLSSLCLVSVLGLCTLLSAPVWADGATTTTTATTSSTAQPSNIQAGVFENTGVGINGNANGANVSNNANTVTTGSNTNANSNQTLVSAPAQAVGGSSALVLPRNPLALGNAGLGRSNFGLQFGLNNNPVFGSIFGKGAGNALGWFMQGGVTIPFGKIPDIIANPQNNQLDNFRQQRLDDDRQVFGALAPNNGNAPASRATVEGRVVSLNAYNYSTAASPKIGLLQENLKTVESKVDGSSPKVIALSDSPVFTRPLNKGQKIAVTAIGDEYRYIGHTGSGWLKLVLPDGRQGWSKGQFEYLKNDYTEIDGITARNTLQDVREALDMKQNKRLLTWNMINSARK
jgi:hypothetical protein